MHDPSLVDMTLQAVSCLLCTVAGLAPSRPHSPNLVSGWSPELSGTQRATKCTYHAWVAAGRPHNVVPPLVWLIRPPKVDVELYFELIALPV